MLARIFLAFLASAGLFYVNIMPAIVDGLKEGLSFTDQQAGFAASANVYGAAVGALLIVFFVKRISWRPVSYTLLGSLITTDLLSMLISSPEPMIAIRFMHGCIGGALVGTGFSVIARTLHPDRTFGVLLFVQFGLGGLGNLYIPRLVPLFSRSFRYRWCLRRCFSFRPPTTVYSPSLSGSARSRASNSISLPCHSRSQAGSACWAPVSSSSSTHGLGGPFHWHQRCS
jgi:MFS family permease